MNDEFYITLPSHRNRTEFQQNQSNHFKIRLLHPIRLQESSWKMGLISILLPDMKVHLPNLVDGNKILFTMDWIMKYPSGTLKFGRTHYDLRDRPTFLLKRKLILLSLMTLTMISLFRTNLLTFQKRIQPDGRLQKRFQLF